MSLTAKFMTAAEGSETWSLKFSISASGESLLFFSGHYFIRLLQEKEKLLKFFTQNVDGLERLAGVKVDDLITVQCSDCSPTVFTSRKLSSAARPPTKFGGFGGFTVLQCSYKKKLLPGQSWARTRKMHLITQLHAFLTTCTPCSVLI